MQESGSGTGAVKVSIRGCDPRHVVVLVGFALIVFEADSGIFRLFSNACNFERESTETFLHEAVEEIVCESWDGEEY